MKGRYLQGGYVLVKRPGHPRADAHGRVREHILVAEKALGKPLPPGVLVHHINTNREDNRPCNLLICTHSYHMELHARMRVQAKQVPPKDWTHLVYIPDGIKDVLREDSRKLGIHPSYILDAALRYFMKTRQYRALVSVGRQLRAAGKGEAA